MVDPILTPWLKSGDLGAAPVVMICFFIG